jgi:hypothetical protein
MRNWHLYASGHLLDGAHVLLALIRVDYPSRREFPAVLVCRLDGLYRLWRNGNERLLAPGVVWLIESETSLRQHVPKVWGIQHRSGGVIQQIPARILNARTDNLARLLIAWYFNESATFAARCGQIEQRLRPLVQLPAAPLWRPVAITVVPNTDVVVRALDAGVLLLRLKGGLERIYVSEMAWIRAPRIEASLRALAHRFPERLVLVKAENYGLLSAALKIRRVRASEYQFIGCQLQSQYEDDFDYDKFDNPSALADMFRLRIGDIPRGSGMLWLHELPVDFEQWKGLDIDGMLNLEKQARERRTIQDKEASEALAQTLKSDD